ncbi:MAG: YcxB family protein [Anaerotruncus sp.]|jgi:hypothetical protein|nr:YcxB family protein [Anaerotruncus sp.]
MTEQERMDDQQPEEETASAQPAAEIEAVGAPVEEEQPAVAQTAPPEQQGDGLEKELTLRYRIGLEDYFQFHKITGAPVIAKNKKKFTLIGGFEVLFGAGFLIYLLVMGENLKQQRNIGISILLAVLMLAMGLYSLTFYRYFYEGALRRTLKKQCAKTPYLQNEICVDLYPNKFVEYNEGKEYENFWRDIFEVRVSDTLFMVMLTATRCLLVPKNSIPEQVEEFDQFLGKICTNFEKRKVRI